MSNIYLTNSLTRKKERFEAINPPNIGMYTCGPTVYDYATIGNFRTYTTADILLRTLQFNGYKVKYIMNITDVGHLTGDNSGDADIGEDRLQKGAKREGTTAWDVARKYTEVFYDHFGKLNLTKPANFVKATDHISEQVDLVKKLEDKGLTYKINDGVYFDTVEFEKSTNKKYGELSNLDSIKEGARVETNKQKKNPRDFALWKFSPPGVMRDMEWDSPWGPGFPGWHIECSAMSMKYLGETFDIHVGGEDLRSTHHPNEIAQSEGATGKKFVNYWIHSAFLTVNGGRMGKSLMNAFTLDDVVKKDFHPLALRYFYLTGHYKDPLNFTWEALEAASNALKKLKDLVIGLSANGRTVISEEKNKKVETFRNSFLDAVNDDLNMPQTLAVLWQMIKSNIPSEDKYDLIMSFDEILGLDLRSMKEAMVEIPDKVADLLEVREGLRKSGDFDKADKIRAEIKKEGFLLKDLPGGVKVTKK